jgi:hypothetical protein
LVMHLRNYFCFVTGNVEVIMSHVKGCQVF